MQYDITDILLKCGANPLIESPLLGNAITYANSIETDMPLRLQLTQVASGEIKYTREDCINAIYENVYLLGNNPHDEL
jgi:hypothetical protein